MAGSPFGHVDLRVSSLPEAIGFYEALLPALGFTRRFHAKAWKVFAGEGTPPSAPYFGITEDRSHIPNSNRIAFWAASRAEVDRLAAIVLAAGGKNVSGPRLCPEYSPTYYAVFFDDPCGNRFEIVHRES